MLAALFPPVKAEYNRSQVLLYGWSKQSAIPLAICLDAPTMFPVTAKTLTVSQAASVSLTADRSVVCPPLPVRLFSSFSLTHKLLCSLLLLCFKFSGDKSS